MNRLRVENLQAGYGAVTVLRGASSGLLTTNAEYFSARDVSLKGDASFGWVISQ